MYSLLASCTVHPFVVPKGDTKGVPRGTQVGIPLAPCALVPSAPRCRSLTEALTLTSSQKSGMTMSDRVSFRRNDKAAEGFRSGAGKLTYGKTPGARGPLEAAQGCCRGLPTFLAPYPSEGKAKKLFKRPGLVRTSKAQDSLGELRHSGSGTSQHSQARLRSRAVLLWEEERQSVRAAEGVTGPASASASSPSPVARPPLFNWPPRTPFAVRGLPWGPSSTGPSRTPLSPWGPSPHQHLVTTSTSARGLLHVSMEVNHDTPFPPSPTPSLSPPQPRNCHSLRTHPEPLSALLRPSPVFPCKGTQGLA